MDWQQLVSFAIVGAAAVLLLRRQFQGRRRPRANGACDCPSSSIGPQPSVTFRACKGRRPEVIVRMK